MMKSNSTLKLEAVTGEENKVEVGCSTFDDIYDQFAPLVYYILNKKFFDKDVVDDLLQDVFVKVLGSPSIYKIVEKEALKRIICKITSCTIVDYYRYQNMKSKRTIELIEATSAKDLIYSGSTDFSLPHYRELKKKAYRKLKEKRGSKIAKRTVRIIALRCLGYTQKECAEKLEISRSIIQVDLDCLKEIVSRLFPDYRCLKN